MKRLKSAHAALAKMLAVATVSMVMVAGGLPAHADDADPANQEATVDLTVATAEDTPSQEEVPPASTEEVSTPPQEEQSAPEEVPVPQEDPPAVQEEATTSSDESAPAEEAAPAEEVTPQETEATQQSERQAVSKTSSTDVAVSQDEEAASGAISRDDFDFYSYNVFSWCHLGKPGFVISFEFFYTNPELSFNEDLVAVLTDEGGATQSIFLQSIELEDNRGLSYAGPYNVAPGAYQVVVTYGGVVITDVAQLVVADQSCGNPDPTGTVDSVSAKPVETDDVRSVEVMGSVIFNETAFTDLFRVVLTAQCGDLVVTKTVVVDSDGRYSATLEGAFPDGECTVTAQLHHTNESGDVTDPVGEPRTTTVEFVGDDDPGNPEEPNEPEEPVVFDPPAPTFTVISACVNGQPLTRVEIASFDESMGYYTIYGESVKPGEYEVPGTQIRVSFQFADGVAPLEGVGMWLFETEADCPLNPGNPGDGGDGDGDGDNGGGDGNGGGDSGKPNTPPANPGGNNPGDTTGGKPGNVKGVGIGTGVDSLAITGQDGGAVGGIALGALVMMALGAAVLLRPRRVTA